VQHSTKAVEIKDILTELTKKDVVVIPTDKTNSFRIITVDNYKEQVLHHLADRAKEIPRATIINIMEQAKALLQEMEPILSAKEYAFIQQSIDSKAIPMPKILIKDHKKADNNGVFPTRLVVPATNFTAAFSKLGYLAIKHILDNSNVCHT